MRVLLIGNSGAGKSTLARALAGTHALEHLDLDTLVWEPDQPATARPAEVVRAEVLSWAQGRARWVVEGCYGELIEALLPLASELRFLNPGLAACLAHNRARPWEPHKYPSKAAQDAMLEPLLLWTAGYYTRDDAWSYAAHRRIYDAFAGAKREIT